MIGVPIRHSGKTEYSGESSVLSYFHGCVSGIGIAADCKSVASALLVRVQGHPLYKTKMQKESW